VARFMPFPSKRQPEWSSPLSITPEMYALLDAPDRQTSQGRRDYALLLFLYNAGTRADEAAQLIIRDLHSASRFVRILGKGGKERHCPLWAVTVETITPLIANRSPPERVFLNRCRRPLTRLGIHALVERYALQARAKMPSLASKRVSPHTTRHTTASHLLRAGGRYQHDSCLAWSRLYRHHQRLRRNGFGNEGQSSGNMRAPGGEQSEQRLAQGPRINEVLAFIVTK
jgi:integrase/recombinase XerD